MNHLLIGLGGTGGRILCAYRKLVYRDFRDRVDLPCEKNKFDAGGSFAIQFIDRASSRFSPQADALKKLHIKAHENKKAAAG